jgi:hypothetical protein
MKVLFLLLPLLPVGRATAYNPPEGGGQGNNFTMIFLIAYTAVWLLVLIHGINEEIRYRREKRKQR